MSKKKISFEGQHQRREIAVGIYTVKEAAMREAIRRVNMAESVKRYLVTHKDDEELSTVLIIYPHIAGCVSPIISIEEFLEIPETMIDELSKAAMDVNPHWFVMPDQEKKTNETQPTSTEESPTL